jgi:hypothetical protein
VRPVAMEEEPASSGHGCELVQRKEGAEDEATIWGGHGGGSRPAPTRSCTSEGGWGQGRWAEPGQRHHFTPREREVTHGHGKGEKEDGTRERRKRKRKRKEIREKIKNYNLTGWSHLLG